MEKYSITYFSSKTKKIETENFEGETAFIDANNWGKKNLDNFNDCFINKS